MRGTKHIRGSRIGPHSPPTKKTPAHRKRILLKEKEEVIQYWREECLEAVDELAKVRAWLKVLTLYLLSCSSDPIGVFNYKKVMEYSPKDPDRLLTYSSLTLAAKRTKDTADKYSAHQNTWWYKLGKFFRAV